MLCSSTHAVAYETYAYVYAVAYKGVCYAHSGLNACVLFMYLCVRVRLSGEDTYIAVVNLGTMSVVKNSACSFKG